MENNPKAIHVSASSSVYIRAGYWFGWYDIREVGQAKRNKYEPEIDRVTLTGWGQQCLTVLIGERPFRYWNKNADDYAYFDEESEEPEARVSINTFSEVFRTLLSEPDLLSLYPINPNPPTGLYWIRAEVPRVSQTIAMPADSTLDDLHLQIQKAFNFDNDHLYGFYLNPKNPYNGEQYYDPCTSDGWADGYPAAETLLASLNLYEGQLLLYVFDFGDQWEFRLIVVRHLPDEQTSEARMVETVGKTPAQYGHDDEGD